MELIKVSIVITTRNRVELLKKAIESVKNQTYKNLECFIVDDASDYDIEPFIINTIDERFKIIKIKSTETRGGNYARNLGISNCSGAYVALLDDDDIWMENKIEEQLKHMENNQNVGIVYCGRTFCYSAGLRQKEVLNLQNQGDCSKRIFYNIICTTSTIMFRRELFVDDLFDEELQFWQEYDLMIRLCQRTQVGVIDKALVDYLINQNDVNRKTNKYDEWIEAVEYIGKKYRILIDELTSTEKCGRKLMIDYDAVNRLYASGRKKERRKIFWRMFKNTKSLKYLIKCILNWDRNDTVYMRQKLKCYRS